MHENLNSCTGNDWQKVYEYVHFGENVCINLKGLFVFIDSIFKEFFEYPRMSEN